MKDFLRAFFYRDISPLSPAEVVAMLVLLILIELWMSACSPRSAPHPPTTPTPRKETPKWMTPVTSPTRSTTPTASATPSTVPTIPTAYTPYTPTPGLTLRVVQVGWPGNPGPSDGARLCQQAAGLLTVATLARLVVACSSVERLILTAVPTSGSLAWMPGASPPGTIYYTGIQFGMQRRGTCWRGAVVVDGPNARVAAHEQGHCMNLKHSGMISFSGTVPANLSPRPDCTQVVNQFESHANGYAECSYPDGSTVEWREYGPTLMGDSDTGDSSQPLSPSQLVKLKLLAPTPVTSSGVYDVPVAGSGALTVRRRSGETYWVDFWGARQRLVVSGARYGVTECLFIASGSVDDLVNGGIRVSSLPGRKARIEVVP